MFGKIITKVLIVSFFMLFMQSYIFSNQLTDTIELMEKKYTFETMRGKVINKIVFDESKNESIVKYEIIINKLGNMKVVTTFPYLQTTSIYNNIATIKNQEGKISKQAMPEQINQFKEKFIKPGSVTSILNLYNAIIEKEFYKDGNKILEIMFVPKLNSKFINQFIQAIDTTTGQILYSKIFDQNNNVISQTYYLKTENFNGCLLPTAIR